MPAPGWEERYSGKVDLVEEGTLRLTDGDGGLAGLDMARDAAPPDPSVRESEPDLGELSGDGSCKGEEGVAPRFRSQGWGTFVR